MLAELTGVLLAEGVVPADDDNGNTVGCSTANGIFLLNQAPDFFKKSLYSAHILQSQIVACFDVDRASILHEEQTFLRQLLHILGLAANKPKLQLHMRHSVSPLPCGLFIEL